MALYFVVRVVKLEIIPSLRRAGYHVDVLNGGFVSRSTRPSYASISETETIPLLQQILQHVA